MPSDYYDDGADQSAEPQTETQEQPANGAEEEKPSEGKTALINSEIAPNLEVGDTIVLEVVGVNEGEYQVKALPNPEESEEQGEPEPKAEAPMMGGMYE